MCASIEALAPRFPHQSDHLAATVADLRAWADDGFGVPDFVTSLELFRPDLIATDGIEHFAVFPMYTQNGNPNRNFEAVVTRTFWPDWLAEQERTYDNAAFVPIEFVGFTKGYDTHSAVFFPETVATGRDASTSTGAASSATARRRASAWSPVPPATPCGCRLPPDVDLLLNDQQLAQETFVLWDLIHDRTHSRGDLPFDPFMIKQRMPYWMYALEELRCDLSTFRETLSLDEQGVYLGRFIRNAIVFDRLFRFTITGDRVRNYDGLGGQIIFAWLHRDDVLRWTDNTLTIDWNRITDSMVALCDAVEALYHGGIDRSRLAQWLAAHQFVSGLVEPHPASVWAKGARRAPPRRGAQGARRRRPAGRVPAQRLLRRAAAQAGRHDRRHRRDHGMSADPPVAIIAGTGGAGTATASELGDAGFHVVVLDSRPNRPARSPTNWRRAAARPRRMVSTCSTSMP